MSRIRDLCKLEGIAQATEMSESRGPRHFPPMAGQTYELGPMTLAFKPSEAEVDGVYSMIESMEPPGASVDLHRHPSWQETFVVLEGRFDFEVAGARHALGPRHLGHRHPHDVNDRSLGTGSVPVPMLRSR